VIEWIHTFILDMTQEQSLQQIDDILKNPTISHESWTKVKGLLETATANDKAIKVVQFKDGSILKELYKAMERNIHSGQTDTIDDILESILVLSETERGKEIGWSYLKILLSIVVEKVEDIDTKLEVCKLMNSLLGKLPKSRLAGCKKPSNLIIFSKDFINY